MDASAIQRRRWVILGVVVVGLLAIVIDNTVLNVALKTIASPPGKGGIGASQSALEWAINSYTLVFAGLLFTFGVVGDRIGRKRVLMAGLVLFGLGSLFSAYSHSPDQLIAARAVMGLGGAAVMPQTLSIIANVFEPGERARAIGIWTSAVGIGVAIGPVLGGLLLTRFWWGSVFLINVPVTAAGVVASLILIPESRNPAPGKIDYVGVLASVLGLVLLVFGIVQGGDGASWGSPGVLGPVLGGLVVLGLFAWYESRIEHPSLDVRLFRHRALSASIGSIALLFFGMGGVYFFSSFYLQNARGYSPLATGLLAVPFAVAQFVTSPRSASLVSRFGVRSVMVTAMLMNAIAIGGWAFLGARSPIWVVAVLFFVQGAGLGLAVPAATSAVMQELPRERAGAGSALTNVARQVAVALSVAVLGSILSSAYRNSLTPALNALPSALRGTAGSSITATQAVAAQLGHAGQFLLAPADSAFVNAMRVTTAVAAILAVAGGFAVLRWLPGRKRPTIEELVAEELEAAERAVRTAVAAERTELSER
ncbi:MAG TPA: MFS transporter [Trebonia sp.]|nr:MFS transporter [Trebonia sp.]